MDFSSVRVKSRCDEPETNQSEKLAFGDFGLKWLFERKAVRDEHN